MLTITFLHCVKSGYSPMKCGDFNRKAVFYQINFPISFLDKRQKK